MLVYFFFYISICLYFYISMYLFSRILTYLFAHPPTHTHRYIFEYIHRYICICPYMFFYIHSFMSTHSCLQVYVINLFNMCMYWYITSCIDMFILWFKHLCFWVCTHLKPHILKHMNWKTRQCLGNVHCLRSARPNENLLAKQEKTMPLCNAFFLWYENCSEK